MSEKIQIHPVSNKEEYNCCLTIRKKVFVEEQGVPKEAEIDSHEKIALHFLAFYDDKPAATGRFRIKTGFVKFERIATLPEFRGKGVASMLMKAMQSDSVSKHPDFLPLMHAQISAISFYLKLGWMAIGKIFVEDGIEHKMMILPPKEASNLVCLSDPKTEQSILDYFASKP